MQRPPQLPNYHYTWIHIPIPTLHKGTPKLVTALIDTIDTPNYSKYNSICVYVRKLLVYV